VSRPVLPVRWVTAERPRTEAECAAQRLSAQLERGVPMAVRPGANADGALDAVARLAVEPDETQRSAWAAPRKSSAVALSPPAWVEKVVDPASHLALSKHTGFMINVDIAKRTACSRLRSVCASVFSAKIRSTYRRTLMRRFGEIDFPDRCLRRRRRLNAASIGFAPYCRYVAQSGSGANSKN